MTTIDWGEHVPNGKSRPYRKVLWVWGDAEAEEVAKGEALYLIHTHDDTYVLQRGVAAPVSEKLRIGPVFTDLQAAKMFYLLTN